MAHTFRRNTAGTNAERGDGRILEVEEICRPKVSALSLGPFCVLSRLAAKLAIQCGELNGVIEKNGFALAFGYRELEWISDIGLRTRTATIIRGPGESTAAIE